MKTRLQLILLFLFYFSTILLASSTRVSMQFSNASLSAVILEIEHQTGYSIIYKPSLLTTYEKFTYSFYNRQLNDILNTVLPEDIEFSITKKVIVLKKGFRKKKSQVKKNNIKPITLVKIAPKQPTFKYIDSINIYTKIDTVIDCIILDTIYATREDTVSWSKQESEEGSFFQASFDLGYGALNYNLPNASNTGGFQSRANFAYSYFFDPHWGIGTGIIFDNYTSKTVLNTSQTWIHVLDAEGEYYDHTDSICNWTETNHSIFLEIPLSVHYKVNINSKLKFLGSLGAKLGIAISNRYEVSSGTLTQSGYYPQWGLTLNNIPGRFETQTAPSYEGDFQLKPSIGGLIELGFLFKISKKVELLLSTYANMSFNNISTASKTWEDNKDIITDPSAYSGILDLTNSGKVNTFSAGIRLGINLHLDKLKRIPQLEQQQFIEKIAVDTIYKEIEAEYIERIRTKQYYE